MALASAQIMPGMENLLIAGGTEMMSLITTMAMEDHAAGVPPFALSANNSELAAQHPQPNQGVAADTIAAIEGITRAELDAFGLESQRRAAVAIEGGRFAKSLIPVRDQDGDIVLIMRNSPARKRRRKASPR